MSRHSIPRALSLVVLAAALSACGGGESPTGPAPSPAPSAAPTPAPTPVPTPTPDPRVGLAAGPIVRFTIKPRVVEPEVREPAQDAQGRFILFRDERVDFDGTQKNASNEICAWINPPTYFVNGQNMAFDSSNGVVLRRGSSQPFLLKLTMENRGSFSVSGTIDGIDSNVLQVVVQ